MHLCRVISTAGSILCYPRGGHSLFLPLKHQPLFYQHLPISTLPAQEPAFPTPQGRSRQQQPTHTFSLLRYAAHPMGNQRLFPLSLTTRSSNSSHLLLSQAEEPRACELAWEEGWLLSQPFFELPQERQPAECRHWV